MQLEQTPRSERLSIWHTVGPCVPVPGQGWQTRILTGGTGTSDPSQTAHQPWAGPVLVPCLLPSAAAALVPATVSSIRPAPPAPYCLFPLAAQCSF